MRADAALEAVRRQALWFEPAADGFAALIDAAGDARLVLIGEASHGTHEFYAIRAALTRALIEKHGFTIVAVVGASRIDPLRVLRVERGINRELIHIEARRRR